MTAPTTSVADWPAVKAWRSERRAELRARRLALAPAERRAADAQVIAHLEAGLPELAGLAIGFYWASRGEVDLLAYMGRHVAAGGAAALPVAVQRNAPLEWWRWTPETEMEPGLWKIPVPAVRDPVAPAALLVPLLGFDAAGHRLGNGGGYYDRSLAAMTAPPLTVGVGHALGQLNSIRPQAHDRPLDGIVTEDGPFWPLAAPSEGASDSPSLSSPVCYAEEGAPEYFGYLSDAETGALLRALRADLGAALRQGGDVARQRELLRAVALLAGLAAPLAGLTGLAGPGEAAKSAKSPEAPGALQLAAHRLAKALPRVRDEALRAGLQRLWEALRRAELP